MLEKNVYLDSKHSSGILNGADESRWHEAFHFQSKSLWTNQLNDNLTVTLESRPYLLISQLTSSSKFIYFCRKIVELEEELRVVGNNLKSLEVSEEKVRTILFLCKHFHQYVFICEFKQ